MADNSLVAISDAAKTFVEEISKGIGGLASPWQIKRIAQAEIEAEDLKVRAQRRREIENINHQKNLEDIIIKAMPHIEENAKTENVSNDWKSNLFDKCKNISDDELQDIWSRILAGEVNNPGSYSTGTVNLLSNLEKEDANLFVKLNSFTWLVIAWPMPLIFDVNANIYRQNGITWETLTLLDEIGLINYGGISRSKLTTTHNPISIFYEGQELMMEGPQFDTGVATLTRAGKQLLSICKSPKIEGIYQYVEDYINNNNAMPCKIVGKLQRNSSLCPWLF